MTAKLDINTIQLFILFIFPGLISMHVYRLLMPAKRIDWKTSLLEGLFYSGINFALLLPIIIYIHYDNFWNKYPIAYSFIGLFVLLVTPVLWPFLYRKLIRSNKIMSGLQLPFPSAWDFYFDKREEVFLLIHLNDGKMVGGFFGEGSYATSFPDDGDLYLKAVYSINENGEFGESIENTNGLLIRKDQYRFIELFNVPKQKEE